MTPDQMNQIEAAAKRGAHIAPQDVTLLLEEIKGKPDAEVVRKALVLPALKLAYEFFKLRDRMNATAHNDEPRWSPITIEVGRALELCGGL